MGIFAPADRRSQGNPDRVTELIDDLERFVLRGQGGGDAECALPRPLLS